MKTFWMLLQVVCSDDATPDSVKTAVENAVAVEIIDGEDTGPIQGLSLFTNHVEEGDDQPVIYYP